MHRGLRADRAWRWQALLAPDAGGRQSAASTWVGGGDWADAAADLAYLRAGARRRAAGRLSALLGRGALYVLRLSPRQRAPGGERRTLCPRWRARARRALS